MRIRFDKFELDLAGCELVRDGRTVPLERRPTELLCHLAMHPNVLVTREELARQIWGAAAGIDADMGINTSIRKIRAALGETPAAPRFIETIQGRGYRFIAAIEPAAQGAATIATIAVLAFDNLTGSDAHGYIAEGFTEEMISALGQVEPARIQVIGRRSVMALRHTALALSEIGERLGAGHLLESAIRAEGSRLRATTKLIHAPSRRKSGPPPMMARPTVCWPSSRRSASPCAPRSAVVSPPAPRLSPCGAIPAARPRSTGIYAAAIAGTAMSRR